MAEPMGDGLQLKLKGHPIMIRRMVERKGEHCFTIVIGTRTRRASIISRHGQGRRCQGRDGARGACRPMMSFTLGSIFGFTITTASFIWRSYRQAGYIEAPSDHTPEAAYAELHRQLAPIGKLEEGDLYRRITKPRPSLTGLASQARKL